MAEGGDDSRDPIRCGDCLEEEGYLLNPKVTPCSHVFCEECIRGHLKKTDVFTCKICKVESKFVVEDLPSALTQPTFCDVCEKKGKKNMTAKAYCVTCKRKYCGLHEEAHGDVSEHHQVLTIEQYLKSDYAVEQKLCVKHEDQPLAIGCSMCLEIYCVNCISSAGNCSNGGSHALMALHELSTECKEKLEPQKKVVEEKLTEWTARIEELSDSVENWDKETEEGLRLIDETENKQLSALKEKYSKIRADYVKFRNETKGKITSYIDDDIGGRYAELQSQLKSLRRIIANGLLAEIVVKRKDVESMAGGFLKDSFPSLCLEDQQNLTLTAEKRETEIVLLPSEPLVLCDQEKNDKRSPSAIQLIRQGTISSYCNTVCHYKGYVYAGLQSTDAIDRINEQGKVTPSFIKLTNSIITVRAHNDQLFILMYGQPYKVCVYDLTGTQIRSWDHGDKSGEPLGNKLTLMEDNLLIADVTNKRISVYTTAGNTVSQIPCPAISTDTFTAMCAGGDGCVIVSQQCSPFHVHKFNLTSGAIEWTSDKTTKPICVEYSPPVVLVVCGDRLSKTRVWVLDYNTGDLLRELSDPRANLCTSYVYDLSVSGDTLLVPRYNEKYLLYYKMITETSSNEKYNTSASQE